MTAKAETECLADKLQVGDIVGGKYEIDAILGRGGMGLVVSAQHLQLEERVALKFLTGAADRVPSSRSRFMREARVTAKLRGEHAARVSDFGTLDDGTPYMVMEFLEGTDLRQVLRSQGRLPVDVAVHYIVQACEGLAEAHSRGIVHRDLKPSNLFLTRRPDGTDLVKIVDFGISKMHTHNAVDEDLTAAGAILGSPKYVAPEQLRNSGNVDSRADLWSLGAILYEMVSGHPPFSAESTAALCYVILSDDQPEPLAGRIDDVTPELEAAIMGCLTRDVDRRTQDVADFVGDLYDATGIEGLDAVSQSIRGILDRSQADALGATGAFGTSGSYPQTRKQRALTTSDSGSIRNEVSTGTEPGVAASRRPAASGRKPGLYIVASLLAAALIGVVVWTQMPNESSGASGMASAAPLPDPTPSVSATATATATAPDATATEQPDAAEAARKDAAPEASAEPEDVPSQPPPRTWRRPPRTGGETGGDKKPPKGEDPAPAPSDTKKPRDPFSDRY